MLYLRIFVTLGLITAYSVIDLTDEMSDDELSAKLLPDPTARLFATSVDPDCERDCTKPMPGDLVVSSLGEIRHQHVEMNCLGGIS